MGGLHFIRHVATFVGLAVTSLLGVAVYTGTIGTIPYLGSVQWPVSVDIVAGRDTALALFRSGVDLIGGFQVVDSMGTVPTSLMMVAAISLFLLRAAHRR